MRMDENWKKSRSLKKNVAFAKSITKKKHWRKKNACLAQHHIFTDRTSLHCGTRIRSPLGWFQNTNRPWAVAIALEALVTRSRPSSSINLHWKGFDKWQSRGTISLKIDFEGLYRRYTLINIGCYKSCIQLQIAKAICGPYVARIWPVCSPFIHETRLRERKRALMMDHCVLSFQTSLVHSLSPLPNLHFWK